MKKGEHELLAKGSATLEPSLHLHYSILYDIESD